MKFVAKTLLSASALALISVAAIAAEQKVAAPAAVAAKPVKDYVIAEVNGEKIDSPAKAMELYSALKTSNDIKITVERNGKQEEIGRAHV